MTPTPQPIVMARRGDGSILASPRGEATVSLDGAGLTAFVAEREVDHPRWVWDDTTLWYPHLLEGGLRVRHCADLRLRHNILRNSPLVDRSAMAGPQVERWDAFVPQPVSEGTLFALGDSQEPLDVAGEYELQTAAVESSSDAGRLRLLLTTESTAALIAAEMNFAGLPWRTDIHEQILQDLLGPRPSSINARPQKLEMLAVALRNALGAPGLNPDSPAEVLKALRDAGLDVPDTRSWTLERIAHPAIPLLLQYKKLQRLHTANGWRWLETWVRDGRYRATYVPGGVVTGRWAASGGGALSLPGQLKPAVVADEGWVLVVADVAQLEPRVLAGMSGDAAMARAAQGKDLYQGLVSAGVVRTREDAKLGMLGAMYGATQGESRVMVARLAERYPTAFGLVEAAARAGERAEPVQTFLGRGSPVPDAEWARALAGSAELSAAHARESRSWGRFTRNFVVQGTGAEWAMCWMATLRNLLWQMSDGALTERPHLAFFLHDEIVVHTPKQFADDVVGAVQTAAERAGRLLFGAFPVDFPLDVSVVEVYADAK